MNVSKRWIAVVAAVALLCGTLCFSISQRRHTALTENDRQEPTAPTEITQADTATDEDADGLASYIEELFGTADTAEDTDGDGFSDRVEITQLATDPLVADGEQDSDRDGISNAQELSLGTDPAKRDSDADGLSDSEEVTLSCDPLAYDSDLDGVRDGYEAVLGTDPCVPQESFDVTCTSEGAGGTAVVEMTVGGAQAETLCVVPTANDRLLPEDMPGRLSQARDVTVDGAFENGTVSFALSKAATEPTVYYFSEATQTLEPIVTTLENGTATAEVSATGTYVLLDRTVYESAFVWEDYWGISSVFANVELVLVIDDSASMQETDPQAERLAVARDLIDRLPENSRVGVVRFSDKATALTENLTDDREAAKACLTTEQFVGEGTTHMYEGVQTAVGLYDPFREHTQRVMIVLSDGLPTDAVLREATTALVTDMGITTYTVALGSDRLSAAQTLREYARAVGGQHYTAQTAAQLSVVYEDIHQLVDVTTDTDGDSIPDYYETHMIAFNGVAISLDPTKADTDGDG